MRADQLEESSLLGKGKICMCHTVRYYKLRLMSSGSWSAKYELQWPFASHYQQLNSNPNLQMIKNSIQLTFFPAQHFLIPVRWPLTTFRCTSFPQHKCEVGTYALLRQHRYEILLEGMKCARPSQHLKRFLLYFASHSFCLCAFSFFRSSKKL